jgi:hypothetical protein
MSESGPELNFPNWNTVKLHFESSVVIQFMPNSKKLSNMPPSLISLLIDSITSSAFTGTDNILWNLTESVSDHQSTEKIVTCVFFLSSLCS